MPSGLSMNPMWTDESVKAVFRSLVGMWLPAASPWCWYAYVSLGSIRFPQLICFTMVWGKCCSVPLCHFLTPPIYYYVTFFTARWFLNTITGIERKWEHPGRCFVWCDLWNEQLFDHVKIIKQKWLPHETEISSTYGGFERLLNPLKGKLVIL